MDSASDHPNLVRVLHASVARLPYAIVLEYCAGGDLHSYVSKDIGTSLKTLGWSQRLKIASDVAVGMAYLHSQNIVHRDLKTQNILLYRRVETPTDAVHAKICDFGLAKVAGAQQSSGRMTQEVGSWLFMAPEVFERTEDDRPYTEKVDVYSFAMVIYTMLAGSHLELNQNFDALRFVNFTCTGGRPDEDGIPDSAPLLLKQLMRDCWNGDPSARPSFSEVVASLSGRLASATDWS